MTWIDCIKLNDKKANDLNLVKLGIRSTLSQLLETGILHADTHGGNLLKELDTNKLVYLDFGLVAKVPKSVRESLICSILYFIERDIDSLCAQFDGLMLLPKENLSLEMEESFKASLKDIVDKIFKDIDDAKVNTSNIIKTTTILPRIRFDQLIFSLLSVATKYKFTVPPYFLNNARALASLEGMALTADPNFNLLGELYPYVLKRIILCQEESLKIRKAFRELVLKSHKGYLLLNLTRIKRLHDDILSLGLNRYQLYYEFLITMFTNKEGLRFVQEIIQNYIKFTITTIKYRINNFFNKFIKINITRFTI